MNREVCILSTRTLKASQKQLLLGAGLSILEADFIEIRNKPFALSEIKDNLIFTSQNSVKAVANHPEVQEIRRNPVFCVGEKTAELLDESGFTVLASADYGTELAEIIVSEYPNERFTFFCGNIRRDEMPSKLKRSNVSFNEIEVYETVLSPKKIDSKVDGILFFSPSGVQSFVSQNEINDAICFSIGQTTADELRKVTGSNPVSIYNASRPTVTDTITTAIQYFAESGELQRSN